jgi:predicted ester cyclase
LQWDKWREEFPDIDFAVEEAIAKGSTVVVRWHLTGTHKGKYLGQGATGNRVAVDDVSIDRIVNVMVVSGFDAWDSLGSESRLI